LEQPRSELPVGLSQQPRPWQQQQQLRPAPGVDARALIHNAHPCIFVGIITKINLNLAYIISMVGTYEESIVAFNDALDSIQKLPDNYEKAFDYISLSKIGLMIDHYFPEKGEISKISFRLFEVAQNIGDKINNLKIISMASGNIAKIWEKSGQYEKALQKTRYAIFTAEQDKNDEIAYQWYWQAGRLFKKMGNETKAIQSYHMN